MKPKIHYAWLVCIGCAMLLFTTSGLSVNAFTVYQPYFISLRGFTNTQASLILTTRSLFSLGGMLLCGLYYKKLSLRGGMTLAAGLMTAAFFAFGLWDGFAGSCMAAALMGLGYAFGTMIPVSIVLEHWFLEKRNTALGICSASTGLATLGIPTLLVHCIERFGLRATFWGEAAVIGGLTACCFALIRGDPADKQLTPYGTRADAPAAPRAAPVGLTGRDWPIIIALLLAIGAATSVAYSHLAVLAVGESYTAQTASLAVMLSGIAMIGGKLTYGRLGDRVGSDRSNRLFSLLLIAGLMLCCAIRLGLWMLMAAMVVYGFSLSFPTMGLTVWAGDLSAPADFDRNVRRFQTGYAAGTLLFSSVPGITADWFGGSYVPIYVFFVLCAGLIAWAVRCLYRREALRKEASSDGKESYENH